MQITVDNMRTILAITDENYFADEMRVYLNKSWWRKVGGKPGYIVNIVGLDHVRRLLTGLTDALEQTAKERALAVQERDEARRVAGQLPHGSIESRFYSSLADAIESRLNFTQSRHEPRYDGRDW